MGRLLLSSMLFLPLALIIPAVTVLFKLKGLPTAKTHSPIFTKSLFPYNKKGKPFCSILIRATSVLASNPIIRATYERLSFNVTSILSAPEIT